MGCPPATTVPVNCRLGSAHGAAALQCSPGVNTASIPVPEPTRPPLKRKDSDEATVSALATKARVSRESVQDMYDEELADLESTATVKNFINVIAGNRVRQRLGRQSRQKSQNAADHADGIPHSAV